MMLWSFVFSQQYTNYTIKDGLPSNHIYRITQDYQGFIWFITDKGMVKYDGTTFKTFTTKEGLPTNDIWNIRITPDNKVWFFSKVSKLGYIENNQVFTFESAIKNELLYPVSINQNGNEISFSSSDKNYRLINKRWESENLESKNIYKHTVIHNKIKYILDDRNSKSFKLVGENNKVLKKIANPRKYSLQSQRRQINDSLYLVYNKENYSLFNLNTLKLINKKFPKSQTKLTTNYVRCIAVNNLILFTGINFLGKLKQDYSIEIIAKIPPNLNSHFSFLDKNENIWIATEEGGVYFISKAKRKAINLLKGEKVGKLKRIKGELIANVRDKGFYTFDLKRQKFSILYKAKEIMYSANYIKELNTSYYCTNISIIKRSNNIKKVYTFPKISNETARQLVYYKDKLYGNTSFGINILNSKTLDKKDSIHQSGIRNMLVFKEKLLFATANGLKKLEKDHIDFVFQNNKKLNKPLLSLKKISDEELLVCTDGFGAYISDLKNSELLDKSDYLSVQNGFIKDDKIWLATTAGVWYYLKKSNTYTLSKKYTVNDGLSSNLINDIVIVDDKIIATSNDGVSIIPISTEKQNLLIDLYFNKINYNNKPIDSIVSYTKNNHFSFAIGSINFSVLNDINYSYQLLPIQKKWITTASSQISFNDLPPNTYQLNIKSKEKSKSITFKITPLWHQTLAAKLLFLFLSISFVTVLVLFVRKRELKKQANKLNAKRKLAEFELYALRSQMNPHFVFNSLNAIQYYLTDNKIDLSEKYLVKFSKLIRMFFEFSKHKMITLDEEISLLNAYLEIEKLRFGKNFNYKIYLDKELNIERKIPTMLLQPTVENAVNHGLFHKKGKGLIEIQFNKLADDIFEIIIQDNGIGRKKAIEIKQKSLNKHLSKSSQILQERISLINQSNQCIINYKISDLDTQNEIGTRVSLIFSNQNK
jgi:ligand-binding sensor domain-containing protein